QPRQSSSRSAECWSSSRQIHTPRRSASPWSKTTSPHVRQHSTSSMGSGRSVIRESHLLAILIGFGPRFVTLARESHLHLTRPAVVFRDDTLVVRTVDQALVVAHHEYLRDVPLGDRIEHLFEMTDVTLVQERCRLV